MKQFLFLFLILFSIPLYTYAAVQVSFEPFEIRSAPLSKVRTRVTVSSQDSINAFEGEIVTPSDVTVDHIEYGNSIISTWIKIPTIKEETISFAGITPGGFQGDGILFDIFLIPKKGNHIITFSTIQILKHDGLGTKEVTTLPSMSVIADKAYPKVVLTTQDKISPEPFIIEILQDPLLFNNEWYAQWQTADKQSGIKKYEILETRNVKQIGKEIVPKSGTWIPGTSPYRLLDQKKRNYVFVRAIDQYDNITIAVAYPRFNELWYVILFIVIAGIVLARYTYMHTRKSK